MSEEASFHPSFHFLLTRLRLILLLQQSALFSLPHPCQYNKPVYTPLSLRDWVMAAPRHPLKPADAP
ncbi:hypothetical protein CG706_25925 [Escherichia coli]|nr:hypothetical protein CG706_25925 [Escherichia coli]